MEIRRLVLGMLRTNCYIVYKKETKKAVIIDPAAEPKKIMQVLCEENLLPEAVLLTHGHFDHILAADTLRKEYQIPVCLYKEESELLSNPDLNCSYLYAAPYGIKADILLEDGQKAEYLDNALRVIATPGHTAGSCCYYAEKEKILFSGDTLFRGTVGRTDLPTSCPEQMEPSVCGRLFALPEEVAVLPGHGENTSIGEEKHVRY